MIFDIYYRNEFDGIAPDAAFLELDYSRAGSLDGHTPKEIHNDVESAVSDPSQAEGLDLEGLRSLRAGDVLVSSQGQGWVLTPSLIWATCLIVSGS